MAAEKGGGTTIIKRIKKGHAASHGGAWKVAYADFVTAMMAFFLLLWLLNSVTQEQLEGISNYFAPASIAKTTSGAGGVLGGQTMNEPGAEANKKSKPTVSLQLPPPKASDPAPPRDDTPPPSEKEAEKLLEQKEKEQFQQAQDELRQAIESIASMKQLAKSLLIDDTPEGLRIQIVDQEGLAMFPRGSADPYLHTKRVIELVAKVVTKMPNRLAISGHTDAVQYAAGAPYTNWELSSDRANASRRALQEFGLPAERIARVQGRAETEPLKKDNPTDASNRRISIVLLSHKVDPENPNLKTITISPKTPLDQKSLLKSVTGAM